MNFDFKAYTHVERLGKTDTEGFLNGHIEVFPKLDGSNASIWSDGENVYCGSRTREISIEKDNANFAAWVYSTNLQASNMHSFCLDHPNLIIFGEWLGTNKLLGAIKQYDKDTVLNHLWVFAIYDRENEKYIDYETILNYAIEYHFDDNVIPRIAALDNPTFEEIKEIADNNHFLLEDNAIGEGVVLHNAAYVNCYGNHVVAKYVRADYTNSKNKQKKELAAGEAEQYILDNYLTEAELSKAQAKVVTSLGAAEFDNHNGKMIGMFMNLCWKDMLEENIVDAVKKLKNPIIDFKILNYMCKNKCKQYLGL